MELELSVPLRGVKVNVITSRQNVMGEQLKSGWIFTTLEAAAEWRQKIQPFSTEQCTMADLNLTPEQEAEAQRVAAIIGKRAQEEALQMARLLMSKPDRELLGATEFEIRDRVHKLGAHAIETALKERKKGGTKGRARRVHTVKNQRTSKNIGARRSPA